MKRLLPVVAAFLAGSVAAIAGGDFADNYGGPGRGGSMYDRIYAHYSHYGRDVREEFRDGPCEVKRHWEKDGDFEEHIECDSPRG